MKQTMIGIVTACALTAASAAEARLEKRGPPIGDWHIYAEQDAMTDALQCVAYFRDGNDIQLTGTSLALSYRGRGGVTSYRIRLDDNPPSDLRLATRIERDISAIVLRGRDFEQIKTSGRVRVQTSTLIRSLVDDDIDMTSAPAAIARMAEMGCT
jgi:hypothetical protein